MVEYVLKKLEIAQIETIWFVLGFIGVVMAIGTMKSTSVTFWKIINTCCSGVVFCVVVPVIMRDVIGVNNIAIQSISAMMGGFMGMKLTATLQGLDIKEIVEKKLGVKK